MKVDYRLYDEEIDGTLAAPCGLYCGNCSIFRAYFDRNHEKITEVAKKYKCAVEKIRCSGCRTESKDCWSGDCEFKECTINKGIMFCNECDEFPCDKIQKFAESASDHSVIWTNFDRVKESGWRQWLREQDEKWRCNVCKAKLEYYDTQCPVCGILFK